MQPWMLLKRTGRYGLVIFRTKPLGFVPCVVEIERDLVVSAVGGFFLFFFNSAKLYKVFFNLIPRSVHFAVPAARPSCSCPVTQTAGALAEY